MIHYYKDTPEGRIWYSGSIKLKDGNWVSNPTKDMLDKERWIPCKPEPPSLYVGNDPLFEDVGLKHFFKKHPESKHILKINSLDIVYHYTTWDVLFKGILSSENVNVGRAISRDERA